MRGTILIAAALAGCAAPAGGSGEGRAGGGGTLSFETNSWGKPLSSWTLESSGRGRYTVSKPAPSGNFHEYDLVTRSFAVAAADYRRIDDLLRPARAYAGTDLPCRVTVTDAVYGRVRWEGPAGGRQVSFNIGCTSDEVAPLYEAFRQAEGIVERLASAGAVVETREVRLPRP